MKAKRLTWFWAIGILALLIIGALNYFSAAIERGPYLQQGSATGVVVRWLTDRSTASGVRYGLKPDQLTLRESSPIQGIEHAVLLSGLTPGTRYYYAIENSRQAFWRGPKIQSFVTAPMSGSNGLTRVWVLGDAGTRRKTQRKVRDAFYRFSGDHPADLWLMLGDNAYRRGTLREYQKALFEIYPDLLSRATLWPTLGNHDVRSSDPTTETGVYFDLFNLPSAGQCGGTSSGTEAYYAFDYGNIHFVCLDSEQKNCLPNGPMLSWLSEDLQANRKLWTIAFWHHPPYTKGTHDSDHDAKMKAMRENAVPILEQMGVDLVLSGHSHDYERSYLLDGHYGLAGTFSETMLKSKSDGRPEGGGPYVKAPAHSSHGGTVYVVAGSSGQTGQMRPAPHPAMCVSLQTAGSLVLDVEGSRLEARFISDEGQVRDHFVILKENPVSL